MLVTRMHAKSALLERSATQMHAHCQGVHCVACRSSILMASLTTQGMRLRSRRLLPCTAPTFSTTALSPSSCVTRNQGELSGQRFRIRRRGGARMYTPKWSSTQRGRSRTPSGGCPKGKTHLVSSSLQQVGCPRYLLLVQRIHDRSGFVHASALSLSRAPPRLVTRSQEMRCQHHLLPKHVPCSQWRAGSTWAPFTWPPTLAGARARH
jgi:hypothetical protein